jgi:hypothetical protein
MVGGRIARTLFLGAVMVAAGCGDMWGDLFSSKKGAAATGDGGLCAKDLDVLTQITLRPPACNATATCPCGSYCSSTVSGVCVVDCRDDSECAFGKTCSAYGQCIGASASDGGIPPNPSCPRNISLLMSDDTLKRHCKFDDICPHGSRCDQASGLCKYECLSDSQCPGGSDGGVGQVCSCLGQCVDPIGPVAKPSATQPSLVVSPNRFPLQPADPPFPATPFWGAGDDIREFEVSISSSVLIGDGATPDVTATPGDHLEIKCPGQANYTAEKCTFNLGALAIVPGTESYKTAVAKIAMRPLPTTSPTEPVGRWEVRVGAAGIANAPQIITAEYGAGFEAPGRAAGSWQSHTGPIPTSFHGIGYVQIPTATGKPISVPVTARGDDLWELVLYDPSKILSESGRFGLRDNHDSFYGDDGTHSNDWLAFSTDKHPNALGGVIASRITNRNVQVRTLTGGGIDAVEATFDMFFPLNLSSSAQRSPTMQIFVHLDSTSKEGLFCSSGTPCAAGLVCDLGFCAPDRTNFPNPAILSVETRKAHLGLNERKWDISNQGANGPIDGPEAIYCGNTRPDLGYSIGFDSKILPVSGEAGCRYNNLYNTGQVPTVTPLLVHKDMEREGTREPKNAAQLLRACLKELARVEPTTGRTGFQVFVGYPSQTRPNPEYLSFLGDCISLGQWSTAASMASGPLKHRLLQSWLEVHAFVGREGLQENHLQETLGPIPGSGVMTPVLADAPSLDVLSTEMEVGWSWFMERFTLREPTDPQYVTVDYRLNYIPHDSCDPMMLTGCGDGQYCDVSGTWGAPGDGTCVPKPLQEAGEHEQPVGLPTTMLNTMTAHLDITSRLTEQAVMETFAKSGSVVARQKAIDRAGRTLRFALWIEALAQKFQTDLTANDACKTCLSARWKDRWAAAKTEFQSARNALMTQLVSLQSNANPLGLRDDDVPLFFGDVTGTNSRYFAASDFLLDGWAAPAVTAAQGSLNAARDAWVARRNSEVQDLDAQANRERILEQIATTYGEKIIDNCGPITVGHQLSSVEVLDEWANENIDLDMCHFDPKCFGTNDIKNTAIRRNIQALMTDAAAKSQLCKLDYLAKMKELQSCQPWFPNASFPFSAVKACVSDIPSLRKQRSSQLESGADDFACFFGTSAPPPPLCPNCNPDSTGHCPGNGCYHVCATNFNLFAAGHKCNVLDRSGCYDEECLFARNNWMKHNADGSQGGPNGGTIPTPDELLEPLKSFEDNPWSEVTVKDGPDGRRWVYTAHKKLGTEDYCAIPVDYLYGFYPDSWTREDWTGEKYSGAWAKATETCSSGAVIGFNPNMPNVTGPRYPFADVPLPMPTLDPKCFSGKMGLAQLSIQEAKLKLRNTYELINAKKGSLEDQFEQCVKLAKDVKDAEAARDKWKKWKMALAVVAVVASVAAAPLSGGGSLAGGALALAYVTAGAGAAASQLRAMMDDNVAEIEAKLGHSMATRACWQAHRDQMRGLADAATQVELSYNQIDAAKASLKKMQDENLQSVLDGRAKLSAEQGRKYGSYAHHYWFDEKVERFKKDLEWSRRLTYLAMQAVEYEFQQSLPFRHEILTATNPDALADVVRGLKQEQGSRSINRRRPEESSVVLSLRDDILKVADRSDVAELGERAWTPAQRFAGQLGNTAFAYFGKDGSYMGQAVPFVLGPDGVLETRCGERLWRVTATVQGDGLSESSPNTSLLLLKRNTFSSQWCASDDLDRPAMQSGSVYPSAQLFRSGSSGGAGESSDFTPALMTPWFNIRRTEFYKDTFRDGASEELAGRGLYGDYVLLFPKQMLDQGFPVEKVEDVLLRIDYLSVDNLSQ